MNTLSINGILNPFFSEQNYTFYNFDFSKTYNQISTDYNKDDNSFFYTNQFQFYSVTYFSIADAFSYVGGLMSNITPIFLFLF